MGQGKGKEMTGAGKGKRNDWGWERERAKENVKDLGKGRIKGLFFIKEPVFLKVSVN